MKVGVLAVQGDFEAHGRMLSRLGADPVYVRTPEQLGGLDCLILPGGESTTMLKFLDEEGLFGAIRNFGARRPLMGTCAGTILMATDVTSPAQRSLGLIEMEVERNAYGRQLDSHIVSLSPSPQFSERAGAGPLEAVFIRAPVIRRVSPGATVLLEHQGDPVLVEQGRHLAATFHPELTSDTRVHHLFLRKATEVNGSEPVRVLFICIGNSCRSPMAEGFARHHGAGLIEASSAGLFPARIIQPETYQVMAERGVTLNDGQVPRSVLLVDVSNVDLVVNMSGQPVSRVLGGFNGREISWDVPDPVGMNIQIYRAVRDEIEARVRELVNVIHGPLSRPSL